MYFNIQWTKLGNCKVLRKLKNYICDVECRAIYISEFGIHLKPTKEKLL